MKEISNVYVIILNYNSSYETIELFNQLQKFYTNIHIIVIDNHSEYDDLSRLREVINEKYLIVNKTNLGFAGGINVGIKIAKRKGAKYVFLLNPDIKVENNTLPVLIKTIQSSENIASVGPRICYRTNKNKIYSDGGIVIKEKGFYTNHININKLIVDNSSSINNVDYVNGSAMLINISALEKIGLMLEDFFLYFEETEWCLRAKDFGYKLLVNTKAKVYHKSSVKGKLYKFYMIRNRILLAKLREEFVFKTIMEVVTKLWEDLKQEFLKLKFSKKTLYGFKGLVFGVFTSINK